MPLTIIRPGLFTTVQDCGRWGHQARAVAVSGAMDLVSHRLANALVGNHEQDATLEVTLVGPEIEFESAANAAVAGAQFRPTLNGTLIHMNHAFHAPAGSRLKFGERVSGARAYLAVAGGIDVPVVLGSRATHAPTAIGGLDGRPLRAGDALRTSDGALRTSTRAPRRLLETHPVEQPTSALVLPVGGATLRVIAAPGGLGHLASHRYTISPQSNRMGYRLEGPAAFDTPRGEMISTAVPTGAVQVPPGGQPILLMNDHATTGGYAIAATVITADLPLAAQLAPGDWIEFLSCTVEDADDALRQLEAAG
jgi:antagonist of KipI